MSRPTLGARLEDGLNRRLIPILRSRGWRPTAIAYTGYGNLASLRVLARVLLTRDDDPAAADVGSTDAELAEAEEAVRGWRSFVTAPVSFLPMTIEIHGTVHHAAPAAHRLPAGAVAAGG